MNKIRVLVNGYGVIKPRVDGAVVRQEDMELIRVSKLVSDDSIKGAGVRGKWQAKDSVRARNRHLDKLRLPRKTRRLTEKSLTIMQTERVAFPEAEG